MLAYIMFLLPEPPVIIPDPGHPVQRGFIPTQIRPAMATSAPTPPSGTRFSLYPGDTHANRPPRTLRARPQSNPPGHRARERPTQPIPVFSPPPSQPRNQPQAPRRSLEDIQPDNFLLPLGSPDGEIDWSPVWWWRAGLPLRNHHLARTAGTPWAMPPAGPKTTPVVPPKNVQPPASNLSPGDPSSVTSSDRSLETPVTSQEATTSLPPGTGRDDADDKWELIESEEEIERRERSAREGSRGNGSNPTKRPRAVTKTPKFKRNARRTR